MSKELAPEEKNRMDAIAAMIANVQRKPSERDIWDVMCKAARVEGSEVGGHAGDAYTIEIVRGNVTRTLEFEIISTWMKINVGDRIEFAAGSAFHWKKNASIGVRI